MPKALLARRVAASAASLGILCFFWMFVRWRAVFSLDGLELVLLAVPVVAGALIWTRPLATQLVARGIWWTLLFNGCFCAVVGLHVCAFIGGGVALCASAALIAAGRSGLDDRRARFQPVAFRDTLLLSLVLALAEAAAFLWKGMACGFAREGWLGLFAPVLIVGALGLLQLRTWGLLVCLMANAAVAILMVANPFDFRYFDERALIGGVATLQVLVPLPMLVAIARGRRFDGDDWRRTKLWARTAVLLGLAALGAYDGYWHSLPGNIGWPVVNEPAIPASRR